MDENTFIRRRNNLRIRPFVRLIWRVWIRR
jgi:hypothetical protein